MVRAFFAVAADLWDFLVSSLGGVEPAKAKLLPAPQLTQPSLATPPAAIKHTVQALVGDTAYASELLACFTRPVLAFDTQVGHFSYGETLTVTLIEGKFAYVHSSHLSGWVLAAKLLYHKDDVFPQFVSGTIYGSDSIETIKLRRWLADECRGGELLLPLQPTEYMLYQLQVHGIACTWSSQRPRTPGTWQVILRGQPRIYIGVEPKTGTVMEFAKDAMTSVLAFVEAVHPDQSIVIMSVGKEKDGEFLVETLTQPQWRELRPVFINFK